jgi:hypothetical protein
MRTIIILLSILLFAATNVHAQTNQFVRLDTSRGMVQFISIDSLLVTTTAIKIDSVFKGALPDVEFRKAFKLSTAIGNYNIDLKKYYLFIPAKEWQSFKPY